MIIGINGKIGSGKDTVGSIIQYLTSECGDINNKSYRDYELFLTMGGNSNWEIKKFAGKLKEIASLLTGIPIEKFEDQEFKKTMLGPEWNMTVRDFLQILGTEGLRNGLHENVWVNALMCDYYVTPNKTTNEVFQEHFLTGSSSIHYELPNWIITDMRFPNELNAVKAKYGITIHVTRGYILKGGLEDPKNSHSSETALDGHIFDYYIVNDGTIEELIKKVRQILKEEGLI